VSEDQASVQKRAMNHFYYELMTSALLLRHQFERNHPDLTFTEHDISLTWEDGKPHCIAVEPTEKEET
jgi:hypothetical protein